jgi:hypothetical protein
MKWHRMIGFLCVITALVACQKKEEEAPPPLPPPPPAEQSQVMPGGAPADIPKIEGGGVTVVPEHVKGKWKAVVLVVEDKGQKQTKEYTVNLGKELSIPNSPLVVNVIEFLPDLTIAESTFTSVSNEPNNPAVHVTIREGDKEIFKGWLFSLFPTIHPFQHAQYGVTLKEGVPS